MRAARGCAVVAWNGRTGDKTISGEGWVAFVLRWNSGGWCLRDFGVQHAVPNNFVYLKSKVY
ncbi:hypothetical protein E2C01_047850 [Portunus trituberculatus]|uniref:Uncharacterized protein n=1 Tax=Portunus trituberculatus TaxID=210409 RepID=A0A5B7G8U6_PORTR|nr:hypothetical protein [Portunus trituberculatus]